MIKFKEDRRKMRSPNKILKLLVVAVIIFSIAQLSKGAISGIADDTETGLAREWADKAHIAASDGKYDEAISYADKAIQIKPDYAAAYNTRGYACSHKKLYKKAIENYDMAIKINPAHYAAYTNRGSAKYALGLYDDCIEDQTASIKLAPEESDGYYYRASAYYEKKLYDQAIADYTRALEIEPRAFRYDGRARAYLAKGEYQLAVNDMKKAVFLDPGNDKFKQKLAKLEGTDVVRRIPGQAPEGVDVLLMAPGYNTEWEGTKDRDSIQHQFKYIFFPPTLKEIVETVRKTGRKVKIKRLVFLGHGDPVGNVIDLGDGVGFGNDTLNAIADELRKEGDSSVLDAFAENAEIIYLNCMAGLQPKLLESTAELFLAFSGGKVYGSEGLVRSDISAGNYILTTLSTYIPYIEEAVSFRSPSRTDYHTFQSHTLAPFPYRDFDAQQKVVIKGPDSVGVNEKAVLEGTISDQKSVPAEIRPFLKYVWKHEKTITADGKKRLQVRRDIRQDSITMDTSAPAAWRVETVLFLDNGIGARKLGEAKHILFVEKREDVAIDLSSKDIVPAQTYTARAYVKGGEAPKDTAWAWKDEGLVQIEKKTDDTVHFKAAGAGRLSVQLYTTGSGNTKILGVASIPIKPGSTPLASSSTGDKPPDGQKVKPPESAGNERAESSVSTGTALPPGATAGPTNGVSAGSAIESSSGELDGDWIPNASRGLEAPRLHFSRSGSSYKGSQAGDVVFRLNRVSTHIYKGEERSIAYDGTVEWRSVCLAVIGNELFYGGDYGEGELDGALSGIAKRAESKTPKIVLTPSSIAPLKLGEKVSIKAFVTDVYTDDNPVMYTWGGDGEASGDTVNIVAKKPGKFSVSVSASGQTRNLGSASLEYVVESITVSVEKTSPANDTIAVGGTAQFKATAVSDTGQAVGGLNFQWQPHPEIEFEPFEKSATTTATFRNPGTYRIYAQALVKDGDRYVTLGESNEVTVIVSNPSWKLEFNPQTPLVGQEVTAKVGLDTAGGAPEIDTKEMNFRWQLSANARQTGISKDDREITFYLTDQKSAKILCLVSTKYENENLGGAGRTISAKAYSVTIKGPRPRQEFQKWKSNTQLGGGQSTGMKKAENPYVVGQEILFSSNVEPAPEKPVSYDWTVSPDDCTINSNGGSDTSMTCRSPAGYTVKVTARMDGMEIGSAKAGVSVSAAPEAVQPNSQGKPVWKLIWGSLPSGWTVSNGQLMGDRSNVIAGTGERKLVDNPEFANNVYFRFAAELMPRYKIVAIAEIGPAREQDLSTPERIDARFTSSEGHRTPGYQGTRECRFQGHRAFRYDVGSPKSVQKEWGYAVEIDPARKLWTWVMCHVEALYPIGQNEGPTKKDLISKRLELEKTVEEFLEKCVRINS